MMPIPLNSPFKVLRSYGEEDTGLFFGREKETRQLCDELMRSKFIMVYGASGTGKTSLVQCGLKGMYSPRDWTPILIRRSDNFLDAIREELEHRYQERFEAARAQQLEWYPEEAPPEPKSFVQLADLIKALFNLSYVPVYLILDQFEEIFTLGDRSEQNTFFAALKELNLFSEDLFCKILLVTREEYIAHFYRYEKDLPFLFENRFRVEKMRKEQLLSVVNKTLTAPYPDYPQMEVEPGAAEQLLDNLTDKRGEVDLATLQVYLDRLYQEDRRRMNGREYIHYDLSLVGNHKLENVLSEFLDQQVERIAEKLERQFPMQTEPTKQNLPLQILFQLVTDQGTKKNLDSKAIWRGLELGKISIPLPVVAACLDEFSSPDSRILNRFRFAKTAEKRFEIVHDRLAEQVHAKFNADEMRRREAITTIENKRKRFAEAINSKAMRQEHLSVGEIELVEQALNVEALSKHLHYFFERSRKYHQSRRRRERIVTFSSLIAAIIFLVVAVLAVRFANQAEREEQAKNEALEASQHNLLQATKNLLQFELSEYDEIIQRAENYLALNSPEYAYPEFLFAKERENMIRDNFPDSLLFDTMFYTFLDAKIDSLKGIPEIDDND